MATQPLTVAVVEDDPSMRRSIERLLNAYDLTTQSYASAEEFLGSGGADTASCLVLDIHLGGMSGLELRARLTALESTIPVIFITAIDDQKLESQAIESGCFAFLKKPFDAALLIDAINKSLPGSLAT